MDWEKKEKKYIMQTYKRQEVVFTRGRGKHLFDASGRKYLDFFSGISVSNLGHCSPAVNRAVHRQLDTLVHASNHYFVVPQIELAQAIIERSFGEGAVFFSNSGAEANECAMKIARKYASVYGKGGEIIVFENSFHGRTFATLAATGQKKFHRGFRPLVPGFRYAAFNDLASVKKLVSGRTSAVIIEPVQGEGGVNVAEREFLKGLRRLCCEKKMLLIFDEIQCGMGRTGSLFAFQEFGVKPDVFTLAKSIANGLPLGVTVVSGKYRNLMVYGDHGSTFGGNAVSCSAAIEVMKQMDKKMLARVRELGGYFMSALNRLKDKHGIIKEVRGSGLMLGMELKKSGAEAVVKCRQRGLVINCTQDTVLRFMPPFIIEKSDIDRAAGVLDEVLSGAKQ